MKKRKKKASIFSNKEKRLSYLKKLGVDKTTYKRKDFTQRQLAGMSEKDFRKFVKSYKSREYKQKKKLELAEPVKAVFIAKKYLGIWWCSHDDEFSISNAMQYGKRLTNETLINGINYQYEKAQEDKDGSADLHGFYLMYVADTISELQQYEKEAKSRGYTKSMMGFNKKFVDKFVSLQDAHVQAFVMNNKFTEKGFLVMLYALIHNLLNAQKRGLKNELEIYLELYCPDLLKQLIKDGLYKG